MRAGVRAMTGGEGVIRTAELGPQRWGVEGAVAGGPAWRRRGRRRCDIAARRVADGQNREQTTGGAERPPDEDRVPEAFRELTRMKVTGTDDPGRGRQDGDREQARRAGHVVVDR